MDRFCGELGRLQPDPEGRQWLLVAGDQLSDQIGPLSREDPDRLGIVLLDDRWAARRRPYHRQRLALHFANLRQFALEQAARGVAVRVVETAGPCRRDLAPVIRELGPLRVMRPAERELRVDLAPLVRSGGLVALPHEGWLTTAADFAASQRTGPPWRMDAFYRHVRRQTGLLMEGDQPLGGKYSLDAENRKPWPGSPPAPEPPSSEPDAITTEVADLVADQYRDHPGTIDLTALPTTRDDAERAWTWARQRCLVHFGPYEDAMSRHSSGLFHTRISALVNLHRLLPARIVADAVAMDLPLSSQEGFVRQVLGWREFVRHVHAATDGFRSLPDGDPEVADRFGDGGWSTWTGTVWPEAGEVDGLDGGARPSVLGAEGELPPGFWPGSPTGLSCLDRVVEDVWREGWSHHITRLMVLANLATLLDVSPRLLADWFWIAFVDAHDWVVEPNVLAMGTFGTGALMTTKPYVSGAAYLNRMGDYCTVCAFAPRTTCPITSMYWAFLDHHRTRLTDNPRMRLALAASARREDSRRRRDRDVRDWVVRVLGAGERLVPQDHPATRR